MQTVHKIIEARNNQLDMEQYSVFQDNLADQQLQRDAAKARYSQEHTHSGQQSLGISPTKAVRIRKKANSIAPNTSVMHQTIAFSSQQQQQQQSASRYQRIYRSRNIEKSIAVRQVQLKPIQSKQLQPHSGVGNNQKSGGSLLQQIGLSKPNDPSKSIDESSGSLQKQKEQSSSATIENDPQLNKSMKSIFNSIEEIGQQMSMVSHHGHSQHYDSLILEAQHQENQANSLQIIRVYDNKSVQYSQEDEPMIEKMNRQTQFSYEVPTNTLGSQVVIQELVTQGPYSYPTRDRSYQYVQTDPTPVMKPNQKPYTYDQQCQVSIKPNTISTAMATNRILNVEYASTTEPIITVARGLQFPQESVAPTTSLNIDAAFNHLYEKRRAISLDSPIYYSIDVFEEKATKYKWIGTALLGDDLERVQRRLLHQSILFTVYRWFGIQAPEKRISLQKCVNVIGASLSNVARSGDPVSSAPLVTHALNYPLPHIMIPIDPQLQFLDQFDECDPPNQKYPLSESLTFRASKHTIAFSNYGLLLALAYWLNDTELFRETIPHTVAVAANNDIVQAIHRLKAPELQTILSQSSLLGGIQVDSDSHAKIALDRLSEALQLEFLAALCRIQKQWPAVKEQLRNKFNQVEAAIKLSTFWGLRLQKLERIHASKMVAYNQYSTLRPQLKYQVQVGIYQSNESKKVNLQDYLIERTYLSNGKSATTSDILKHLKTKNNITTIYGSNGMGKSTALTVFLNQLNKLKDVSAQKLDDMFRLLEGTDITLYCQKLQERLSRQRKNVLMIDDVEHLEEGLKVFIKTMVDGTIMKEVDVSFVLFSSDTHLAYNFDYNYPNLTHTIIQLQPLAPDSIRSYMSRNITHNTVTAKKNIMEAMLANRRSTQTLCIPIFLALFCRQASSINLDDSQLQTSPLLVPSLITPYTLLNIEHDICADRQAIQCQKAGLRPDDTFSSLTRIAYLYYSYRRQASEHETIRNMIRALDGAQIVRNQLTYYPVSNLFQNQGDLMMRSPFSHQIFLLYYLSRGFAQYIKSGYRNLNMKPLYDNPLFLQILGGHYSSTNSHATLLQSVYQSRKFPELHQQSACALTVLCRLNYVFSNINFDDIHASDADLSMGVFYACTFRNAVMPKAKMFRTILMASQVDGLQLPALNLFVKKYELQFNAIAMAMSLDAKNIVFGCGNLLLIIQADTGKEIKRIEAHLDIIRSVAYGKDGNTLISIADDKTLRIWDTRTYKSIVFKLPQKGSISYSSESETIATIIGEKSREIKVWNIKSMANQFTCEGHSDEIVSLGFSRDGEWILSGSKDTTVRLWSVKDKSCRVFRGGHKDEVTIVRITNDNKLVVSIARSLELTIWYSGIRLYTEKKAIVETTQFRQQKIQSSQVVDCCIAPNSSYMVLAHLNDPSLTLVTLQTLTKIRNIEGAGLRLQKMLIDHSGRHLLTLGKDRMSRVWDIEEIMQREPVSALGMDPSVRVTAVSSSKYQPIYVTSHSNGTIKIWDCLTDDLVDQLKSHDGEVTGVALEKTGKLYSIGSDGYLRIWSQLREGVNKYKREPKTIEISSKPLVCLRLSEKNRIVATSSQNGQFVIYDFTGIELVLSTRNEGKITAIQFSPEQKFIAVASAQKYIVLYEVVVKGKTTLQRQLQLGPHSQPVQRCTFFGEGILLAILGTGQVCIWNIYKGTLVKKIQNMSPIRAACSFDKKLVAFGNQDGKIRIIDMEEGRELKIFRTTECCVGLEMLHSQQCLLAITQLGSVFRWSLQSLTKSSSATKTLVTFERKAVDKEGNQIVEVQSGHRLRLRDLLAHSEQLIDIPQRGAEISDVAFFEDKLVVRLKDNKCWDVYNKCEFVVKNELKTSGDLIGVHIARSGSNFYRTAVRRVKGPTRPVSFMLEEWSTD